MKLRLQGSVTIPKRPSTVGGLISWARGVNRTLQELRDRKVVGGTAKKAGSSSPVPLHILSRKPPYIAEPASPVTSPAKRYFIEWGTINEIVATNWDAHFDLSATRYFFAEITFVASDQLKVASWQILTGAASNTHVTPDWDVGDPRPAKMVILLGVVSVIGTTHTISQSGAGSISVGEQITTINQGGAGETLIGKQLVYQRQNHE
jgi:hypothetical protein